MKATKNIKKRLEYLRQELRAERISYGELAELQALKKYIDSGDTELLQAAGCPENVTKATFISIWDGCTMLESDCLIDEETNNVYDIEQIDVSKMDLNVLEDEYVLLPDGTEIREFTIID